MREICIKSKINVGAATVDSIGRPIDFANVGVTKISGFQNRTLQHIHDGDLSTAGRIVYMR